MIEMENVNKQLLDALKGMVSYVFGDLEVGKSDVCDELRQLIAAAEQAQQAEPGLYAILYRDNWDGEGDVYHLLAEYKDGKWYADESGKELLQYEGDAILRAWPLTDAAQPPAAAVPDRIVEAVMLNITEAWRLGQAMYQYASKSSGKAMKKAAETEEEFGHVKERVRAMLAVAQKGGQ